MNSDLQRFEWILSHIQYLEHGGKEDATGYWPQNETDCGMTEDKDWFVGMDLREYIDERMAQELKAAA